MDQDRSVRITPTEEFQQVVMRQIASKLHERTRLTEQPDSKVLAHQCKEFLKSGGTRTASGWEIEGDRYLIREQNNVVSIVAKDGRGKIFEYGGQKVISDLNRRDLFKLGKLDSVNARLRQHFHQQTAQKRSPRRRSR